jgi:hypothetical protein
MELFENGQSHYINYVISGIIAFVVAHFIIKNNNNVLVVQV